MSKPYVQEYEIKGIRLTSVVIDAEDFNAFCDELAGIFDIKHGKRANSEAIESIRKEGHLPLMARGTKTDKFFKRWGVKTDKMGVVRRGKFSGSQKLCEYCYTPMDAIGMTLGNGWECPKCGHQEPELCSWIEDASFSCSCANCKRGTNRIIPTNQ